MVTGNTGVILAEGLKWLEMKLTHFDRHDIISLHQHEGHLNIIYFGCLRLLHRTVHNFYCRSFPVHDSLKHKACVADFFFSSSFSFCVIFDFYGFVLYGGWSLGVVVDGKCSEKWCRNAVPCAALDEDRRRAVSACCVPLHWLLQGAAFRQYIYVSIYSYPWMNV